MCCAALGGDASLPVPSHPIPSLAQSELDSLWWWLVGCAWIPNGCWNSIYMLFPWAIGTVGVVKDLMTLAMQELMRGHGGDRPCWRRISLAALDLIHIYSSSPRCLFGIPLFVGFRRHYVNSTGLFFRTRFPRFPSSTLFSGWYSGLEVVLSSEFENTIQGMSW